MLITTPIPRLDMCLDAHQQVRDALNAKLLAKFSSASSCSSAAAAAAAATVASPSSSTSSVTAEQVASSPVAAVTTATVAVTATAVVAAAAADGSSSDGPGEPAASDVMSLAIQVLAWLSLFLSVTYIRTHPLMFFLFYHADGDCVFVRE
jgi:hypothetical protein